MHAAARIAGELVEPIIGRVSRRMDGAPVGHDVALEVPVLLQRLVQQEVVFARPAAVDEIVRTHHRARLGDFLDELEGQQVRLAHRLDRDRRIDSGALAFLVVDGEVLHGRDHVRRLDALDQTAGHAPGQQRVFADIFEIPAVARLARQVAAASEKDIEARRLGLGSDHPAAGL